MSQKGETTQVNHKVGGAEQIFASIQNLVAQVNPEPSASSENQIWVLHELSRAWMMRAGEIKARMRGDGYRFSDSLTEKTLKSLIERGLASRIRPGVYQANFKMIFLQALRSAGYGELAEVLDQPGGERKQ